VIDEMATTPLSSPLWLDIDIDIIFHEPLTQFRDGQTTLCKALSGVWRQKWLKTGIVSWFMGFRTWRVQ
jgi:hypothetical protein